MQIFLKNPYLHIYSGLKVYLEPYNRSIKTSELLILTSKSNNQKGNFIILIFEALCF